MKPTYEELEHIACEMSQQDWSDLRFADVYYDAFVAGGRWFLQRYEGLERERNERAAQAERLRSAGDGIWELVVGDMAKTCPELRYALSVWPAVASETQHAALAALKTQWKAEAVRDFADECEIRDFAEQYLRQQT